METDEDVGAARGHYVVHRLAEDQPRDTRDDPLVEDLEGGFEGRDDVVNGGNVLGSEHGYSGWGEVRGHVGKPP